MNIEEFDKQYVGRLNPRASFHCDTCDKYYGEIMSNRNGKERTSTVLLTEDNRINDCVHYDMEITEHIYREHIKILVENGFLDDEDEY